MFFKSSAQLALIPSVQEICLVAMSYFNDIVYK